MRATRWTLLATLLTLALTAAAVPVSAATPANAPARKIVVFKSGVVNGPALARISRLGAVKIKELPLIGAVAVYLPSTAAERSILRMSEVARIDEDIVVSAVGKPAVPQPAQQVPWGITRIGAPTAWVASTGDPVRVAVLDTGIDVSHPDLAVNLKGGVNTINPARSYADDNGHGSHVAGIAGAANNAIGVVGAAPAVDLYAVKVLDRYGNGYLSDIVEGLQWAVANRMDVVNMSFGTAVNEPSFGAAVKATYDSGVLLVAAAGNQYPGADTVLYPAKYPEVVAVSATAADDTLAYFSSTGPKVELTAPGYLILSTYRGSTYKTLSGTSMASPHVAGVAALVMAMNITPTWDTDADGHRDPAEVRAKLAATAQDLGATDRDPKFGYGLVRADLAVR